MRKAPRQSIGLSFAAIIMLAVMSSAAEAQQRAAPAARDAAMRQMKKPAGMGGCLFLAVPNEVRREALLAALASQKTPASFQTAVSEAAPRCTTRGYSRTDLPLIGAVTSTVQRSAAALAIAQEFGVGQESLDQAWASAPPEEKAGFYAAAEQYLDPKAAVSPQDLNVAPLAKRSGFPAESVKSAANRLGSYFLHTALNERAEAVLTAESQKKPL